MIPMTASTWIMAALLTPFWWGSGLLVLALLGDVSPWWRVRDSRLFDRLERPREEPMRTTPITKRPAA
jgi:hypothetical protein